MKNIIVVTGGAGFVGSNLIDLLLKRTKYKIISIDNYSTGKKKNHLKKNNVKYIKGHTKNLSKILKPYTKKICVIFHFGEFSRIYQSFLKMNECIDSNSIGSNEVFNYCLLNKIKFVYSAKSASIGNNGNDKNNKCRHYSISSKKSYNILQVAKMFNTKIKFLPPRLGERYASALTSMNLYNKVHKLFGKINLVDYVKNIVKNQ